MLMFKKVKYFHDETAAEAILWTTDAVDAKQLGKKIQNFNYEAWKSVRDNYMHTALYAKFTQNQELKDCVKAIAKKH